MKINSTFKIFLLGFMSLLVSCLPVSKETSCGENEAYNAQERRCVPTIGTGPNTIFIQNATPVNSYGTNIISPATTHTIAVSDIYNYGFTTRWTLSFTNNSTVINGTTVAINAGSYIFNPTTLYGAGNYILEAGIYNADQTILYDTKSWSISVDDLAIPTLINPSPAASAFTYPSNAITATHTVELSNPDNRSGSYQVLIDTVQTNTNTFTGAPLTISEVFNPSGLGLGLHTIEIQLYDTSNPSNIYDSYVWTINIIAPDLPRIDLGASSPSYYDSVSVISAEPFTVGVNSGYRDSLNNPINEFCIVVDDSDKDNDGSSDIDVIFEINGVQQGVAGTYNPAGLTPNQYCHTAFDTLTLANADISESRTLTVKTVDAGTTNIVELVQWNLNVRPRNMRPLIAIDSLNTDATLACTQSSTVSYTNCSILQSTDTDNNGDYAGVEDADNTRNFAIELQAGSDPDIISETDYEVFFEIRSTNPVFESIDGVSTLTKSDCRYTGAETTGTIGNSKLLCDLGIDSFNVNGNIPPGSYIVQAYIRDLGSLWDANPKESNRVTWQVNVTEVQSANSISIADQATIHPVPVNESWLENTGASCISTGTVVNSTTAINEIDHITVHTFVRDRERDNFNLSIRITNALTGGLSALVPLTTITRTDANEYTEVISCIRVPEFAVAGAASGAVQISVTVNDLPDTQASQFPAAPTVFNALVNNNNPAPIFADNSDVDLSSSLVFSGIPFVITPTSFSDASSTDGSTIVYQWQVSEDNGVSWSNIVDSEANLVWTPAPNITASNVDLRLCLGDDGFGNAADCMNPLATKIYQDVQVFASKLETTNFLSATLSEDDTKNLSTWYDSSTESLYTAYSIGTNIFVNKKMTNTNGQLEDFHTISFPTESPIIPGALSDSPYYLSMDGVDGSSLLISYSMYSNQTTARRIRVRRIDISNGDLAFNYGGLFNNDVNDRLTTSAAGLSFASAGDGDLQITVSSVTNGDSFTISTASGSETFTVGNGAGELCASACANEATLAANIAAAINNHVNFEISRELTGVHTTGATSMIIQGPGADDYINEASVSAARIGNISISPVTGQWVIPFIDNARSDQISLVYGTSSTVNLSSITPSSNDSLITQNDMRIMQGAFQSDGDYIIATKTDSNNLSLYRLNSTYALQAPSLENIYSLSGYAVDEFSFKIGFNDNIYLASINTNGAASDLGAIFADNSLTNATSNINFTITTSLVNNLREVVIAPSASDQTYATIAVVSNSSHVTADNLYVGRLNHDFVNFVNPVTLHETIDTSYSSPALNSNPITADSNLSLSQVVSVTKSFTNESSVAADLTKEIFFLNSMSEDSGTTRINSHLINSSLESIQSNSSSSSGYFPAFIKN